VIIQSDGGAGIGLVAGILAVVLIGLGLIFYAGGFDFGGDKDVNVNIDAPKIDTPGRRWQARLGNENAGKVWRSLRRAPFAVRRH
jgi:hypothetical protein